MDRPARQLRLFDLFPASSDSTLIVRWGRQREEFLSEAFADAADRLAWSFEGRPADDLILLPWLYLYRHALELAMKRSILLAAALRRQAGDDAPGLSRDELQAALKRKFGHRLPALARELDRHLVTLGLVAIPTSTNRVIEMVGGIDPRGESLRYSDQLPDEISKIDFTALRDAVTDAYQSIAASLDALDSYANGQADYLEERRRVEADVAAEFREGWD